jgi:hypothetical protein
MKEELEKINELSLWDFEVAQHEDGRLLILGSNDFTCYHYLEAQFDGVTYCDLPPTFSHAQFRLGRDVIRVVAESMTTSATEFEIRATGLQVRIGKVYYYERENLLPGERIAGR